MAAKLPTNFVFKKSLGQNFIFDTNLLASIVKDSGVKKEDIVLEVGAGAGTLSCLLSLYCKKVISFEIDRQLEETLLAIQENHKNLEFVFGDILKLNLQKYTGQPFHLVANLPYYITTPVIFKFLEICSLKSLTVMVQKEVAQRLVAKENTPEYGAVTAQMRVYGNAKITRIVPRTAFIPPPNVDSAIINMKIEKISGVENYSTLKKTIAASFAFRRKTILNNLSNAFHLPKDKVVKILEDISISPQIRGETLSIEEFVRLSNALYSSI